MQARQGGPTPIGQAIRSLLRERGLSSTPRYERAFRAWSAAVGSSASKHACPVRFRGGVLTVEVDSSSHLQELRGFTGEEVRRKANAELGSNLIQSVNYRLKG